MKKIISMLIAVMLCVPFAPAVMAAEAVKVNVTIASAGELVVTNKAVTVSDFDGDGAISVSDAIYAAHEAFYSGGAAEGYTASEGSWGLSIEKLWGIENGGSYGYYLNNGMCMSLTEPVNDGDYLAAYSYADLTDWSDCYAYFDKTEASGASVSLTLNVLSYDANWNLVSSPAADAVIYVDGKATSSKTDANGRATISFVSGGAHTVSAKSDTQTLVPPVCIVTVPNNPKLTPTGTISSNTYTVASGDCLWDICLKLYGNGAEWGKLFELNSDLLTNPRLIYPGQVLKLF